MDIEVQNMEWERPKMSFEVQNLTFEGCFKTKMTFRDIPEYSPVIPVWFYTIFMLF